MKVIGLAGYSGSGKTTLIEQLIAGLKAAGQRVSVVKHAHKDSFDIDHPGKDSWRHRQAGALEVVVANARRMALIREFPQPVEIEPHALLAELAPCDWALVEGFKHGDLPKIEVWRAELGRPAMYPNDPFIVGIATDDPAALPEPTGLPVFRLDAPEALLDHLLASGERYQYTQGHHG
ncbi:molybdopterin-guanine dinucleotide biosynthesis protein B [Ideonella sp. 4Y16]|uniref:molybdopterin-guanine dinucleotide biosynthesis protein B n=1 Tax=Ideonella alba TaxID=2824118 RepID=UPI001B38FB89|nr:molybdopterin-guanine dinucleotide biosynthesis protein B [Ideonella alba]MBQ0945124.1 molybdopterin-guanine dinucleotide biosynthesis protein B [Ideonella alba]